MKKLFTLTSTLLLLTTCFSQNTWSSIASFGGGERERAVSFVVGGRAYVGTGLDTSNTCKKDFWEYDPGSNSWSQKADMPGSQRRDAIAFAIGNRGYVGTGINGFIAWTGSKKDDFYEYNPITNTWTEKDNWEGNFGGGIYYASAFATPLKGYLVCGKLGSSYYSNELWEYDPVADDWVKKANFPAGTRYGATAFSIAGAGTIKISTVTPDALPWTGVYFDGNPVVIIATPNPGYAFVYWDANSIFTSPDFNASIELNIPTDETFRAVFTTSGSLPSLAISELNYHSDSTRNAGDWIELLNFGSDQINLTGWKFTDSANEYFFPAGTMLASGARLVLAEDILKFNAQHPGVEALGPLDFEFSNSTDSGFHDV